MKSVAALPFLRGIPLFLTLIVMLISSPIQVESSPKGETGKAYLSPGELLMMLGKGENEILSLVVKSNPAVMNVADDRGATPLHIASFKGLIREIGLLLKLGDDLEKEDQLGWAPLHYAVAGKRLRSVLFLLDKQADTNHADHNGNTPLFFAVANKNAGTVKALLKKGADPRMRNKSGDSPLTWAPAGAFQKFCRRIFGDHEPKVPVGAFEEAESEPPANSPEESVSNNRPSHGSQSSDERPSPATGNPVERKSISHDLPCPPMKPDLISTCDKDGATPLHRVAFLGQLPDVRDFLQAGGAIDAQDHQGWTPLHYAIAGNQEDTVRYLLSQGANPFLRDHKNVSPVRLATLCPSPQMPSVIFKAVASDPRSGKNLLLKKVSATFTGNTIQASWTPPPAGQRFEKKYFPIEVPVSSLEKTIEKPIAIDREEKTKRGKKSSRQRRRSSLLLMVPLAVISVVAFAG